MKVLWESSPQTITHLTAALKDSTGWDKHTVIPILSRLEADDEKYAAHVLSFDTIGGAIEFRYSTAQITHKDVQKGPEIEKASIDRQTSEG